MGGPDIGTPAFGKQVGLRSGGNSKVKAFSIVNEEILGFTLFAGYQITGAWAVETYWNKKIKGRNTDAAKSFGFGVNYLTW